MVATAKSDSDGHFRIPLPPGTYVLQAERTPTGAGMFGTPLTVTVTGHAFTQVTLWLDTGMR